MIAATGGLVREASQVSFSELLDPLGTDSTLLTLSLLFFLSGSPIYGGGPKKGCLITVKEVCLRCSNIRVYPGRAIGTVTEEKLPNEPTTAEGTQKAASSWL